MKTTLAAGQLGLSYRSEQAGLHEDASRLQRSSFDTSTMAADAGSFKAAHRDLLPGGPDGGILQEEIAEAGAARGSELLNMLPSPAGARAEAAAEFFVGGGSAGRGLGRKSVSYAV